MSSRMLLASGALFALSCSGGRTTVSERSAPPVLTKIEAARQRIKHVIFIQQENRSFDEYLGAFPGVEGFTFDANGVPTVCIPDPGLQGKCVHPYHDTADRNIGGPHDAPAAKECIDGGKMDGFIARAEKALHGCTDADNPACENGKKIDVMGYHTDAEIPNYWAYGKNFVIHDHMFESIGSWSEPSHLFLVSGWSAKCADRDAQSCVNSINGPYIAGYELDAATYAWTDITWLLHHHGVSWRYYLSEGNVPDCDDGAVECPPVKQLVSVPSIWNPLPSFVDVKIDGEVANVVRLDEFFKDVHAGTLPAVSWIAPDESVSEHPNSSIAEGQAYVTGIVNAVMQSPLWADTAIFLDWDDWGGFFDHVPPPAVDENGYGIRVPSFVISSMAKKGYVDKQILSFDAHLKLIEDLFCNGERLNPRTDGRPDKRPTVREEVPILGDELNDFDFDQKPLPPLILSQTVPASKAASAVSGRGVP
jgi:phospholipase C